MNYKNIILIILVICSIYLIYDYIFQDEKAVLRKKLEKIPLGKKWLIKYDDRKVEQDNSDILFAPKNKKDCNDVWKNLNKTLDIISFINNKKLSSEEKQIFYDYIKEHPTRKLVREFFVDNYAWAIPTEKCIESIAEFIGGDTCLEVGCGLGIWAYFLKNQYGVNIIATDDKSTHYDSDVRKNNVYFDYHDMKSLDAVKKFREANALLLVWPPYDNSMGYDAIKEFRGNKFIYVGEERGGCTGTDDFFDLLENEWIRIEPKHNNMSWPAITDSLVFYERKNKI